ncbi:MAG: YjgN family protein [Bacteroidales bacterium]
MEELSAVPTKKSYNLMFHGNGMEYFGIVIVNWFLTAITLGFYYPWAKAKQLQYMYGSTELNNDRFSFHGTGKEMFKGFIKAIIIFGIIYGIFWTLFVLEMPNLGILFLYLSILAITPIAIHGSYRYRMSRSSWRGIRFGYRGDRKELTINFFKWLLFTILSIGLYSSWFAVNLRKFILGNVKLGSIRFNYEADGGDYFLLNLKGYFLTIITLGIYMFWWQKELFEFYINNISLHKDEQKIELKSTATGGGFFGLMFLNLLILVFTLGLGYAWIEMRTMKYITENIVLEGDIDLDTIQQTEESYNDATGDDMSDMLDINFIV